MGRFTLAYSVQWLLRCFWPVAAPCGRRVWWGTCSSRQPGSKLERRETRDKGPLKTPVTHFFLSPSLHPFQTLHNSPLITNLSAEQFFSQVGASAPIASVTPPAGNLAFNPSLCGASRSNHNGEEQNTQQWLRRRDQSEESLTTTNQREQNQTQLARITDLCP